MRLFKNQNFGRVNTFQMQARRGPKRPSTPNMPYTSPQDPQASITVSPSGTLLRDQIFDVTVKVWGLSDIYDGTLKLKLSHGDTHQVLGSRGKVQMYDFASGESNLYCKNDTSITTLTFDKKDRGVKTFKAVINIAQTVKIRATHVRTPKHDFDLSVETEEIQI